MVAMGIVLLIGVLAFGIFFFRLHTMPERIAHKSRKIQFEVVAVLGLIALFTHIHIFWIAGLLLALIDLPDFGTSLNRIVRSTEKLAGLRSGEGDGELSPVTITGNKERDETAEATRMDMQAPPHCSEHAG
jgi:hypothetical protein